MKAMTCRALGGACDLAHHGAIADDVTQGPGPAPAGSGRRGRHHLRQGARRDEGRMEAPHLRDGLVSRREAPLRRASRRLDPHRMKGA
jgi:hypothetical protein